MKKQATSLPFIREHIPYLFPPFLIGNSKIILKKKKKRDSKITKPPKTRKDEGIKALYPTSNIA